ncbi:helix-turn-helix domain-containing protein [Novimethylophilus kurashikiensis]|uniref:helix-turn-helix domain-containing protein n=1 Tax=Novimethylophilus kurashikiensis TaxID=1825523 RepID=UPI000D58CF2C|nr:helix-turn-helix transcriptional regulator [Novimethylophilus kurashikiensis]
MDKKAEELKLFGKVLRDLREEAGKTQETLALDSGLDRTYISKMERGVASATLSALLNISEALGLTLSQIFLRFENSKQILGRS